jgi:hypothetical protein
MLKDLRVVINVSKGSPLTGAAWINVLFGGIPVVEKSAIDADFKPINEVKPNQIEFTTPYDDSHYVTLTVINNPETIGPIQIYHVDFYLDGIQLPMNWQSAIKGKPLRFGGQPNITIFNPHINDPKFNGWCSVPDVSPGMSITWGLPDLLVVRPIE